MLKKPITYEDFNGDTVTEDFYFNISGPEMIELEAKFEGGLGGFLERLVKINDKAAMIEQFKEIILISYGEKSADGKSFVKSDEMRTAFSHHAAYNELFMELATEEGPAAEFINGIMPKKAMEKLKEKVADKPVGPPTPPTA